MDNIKIDNQNSNHTNHTIDSNQNSNLTNVNIIKPDNSSTNSNSNIGLELLMNDNKKKNSNIMDVKINPNTSSNTSSNNDDFNLENLLSENNIDELKLDVDDIKDVNLDNNIFSINSNQNSNHTPNQNSNQHSNQNSSSSSSSDFNTSHVRSDDLNNSSSYPSSSSDFNLGSTIPDIHIPQKKTYEEMQQDKFNLLCNLERLEARGIKVSKTFSMESDYEEMKREYERIKIKLDVDKSVRFQRKMLTAFVTAIEFLNNKFDPMDIKLDGWSESVHENINDYDDIFEELHEKYKEQAKMAPELRLILMLAGSGFMFHLTQTLFKTSLPGIGDIMKQNPDLMNQFAKAAAGSMGTQEPGLGNLMGDLMGNRQNTQNTQNTQSRRPEMNGPPNINDILGSVNNNSRSIDLENLSNISESDIEQIKKVDLQRKMRRKNTNNKNEITLDF